MNKSFCTGCKFWVWCVPTYPDAGFHYCAKFNTDSLLERKESCGGNCKKPKEQL